jgi:hypothetical protein
LFGKEGSGGPYSATTLLLPRSQNLLNYTWNAGRHAPGVTLQLVFDTPITVLKLNPQMKPKEGIVGIVITTCSQKIAHHTIWHDGEWVSIELPSPSSELLIEFMESSSWIALHAVDAS